MIDWTKPIETVEGRPARFLFVFKGFYETHAVILTDPATGWEELLTYFVAGTFLESATPSKFDLRNIMTEEKP